MKRLLPLAALAALTTVGAAQSPAVAQIMVGITVNFAPPALPIYDQPPIPAPDYIWLPGYWAWDGYVQDYFWVPGTWMQAPRPGLLWTPAWWGWQGGSYSFHEGFWGSHVGFYGGVPYGFGYTGSGYQGAYWNGGHVYYNRSVTNVTNVHVTNVYNQTVIVNHVTNVSYNGGPGGIQARPSYLEQAAMREPHVSQTPIQRQHFQMAQSNRQLFASANHGRPAIAATARPAVLNGPGIVPTRQAAIYHPQGGTRPNSPSYNVPQAAMRSKPMPQDSNVDPRLETQQDQMQPVRRQDDGYRGQTAEPQADRAERPLPPARSDRDGFAPEQQSRPIIHQNEAFAPQRTSPPPERPVRPPTPPHDRPPPQPHPSGPPHPHPHPQGGGHPKPPSPHHDDHHG